MHNKIMMKIYKIKWTIEFVEFKNDCCIATLFQFPKF
jgi:hypothetical protein